MTEPFRRNGWLRLALAGAAFAVVWLAGKAVASPQAAPASVLRTSDQAFKNIRVMKGIPVDDFMGIMGAALGFDCFDCNTAAATEKVDWAADTPKKARARQMVQMMTAINSDN